MLRASGGSSGGSYAAGCTLDYMTRHREAGTYDLLMASVVLPRPYRRGDEDDALAFVARRSRSTCVA